MSNEISVETGGLILAYVEDIIFPPLRMKDWHVYVSRDYEEDEDAWMSMHKTDGKLGGVLRMGVAWKDQTPEEFHCSLIHEILHLRHGEIDQWVRNEPTSWMPHGVCLMFENGYRQHTELFIDEMARSFAAFISGDNERIQAIYDSHKE